ncbi:progonadoliberin-2 [Periophthalmus magnuspinnatus]|uniref:progonadoliberin-2 n=1 Tax=Periophthalmus magnuspinnatus TaxID=409849 RepID=UPI00145C0268|nr:progonadoliberin-2 [Periophthalmus magnuspinnatus]
MLHTRLLVVMALIVSMGVLLSSAQHWSHGWYPGGKRELDSEISGEIKLCESGECSYLRPQRRSILRNIFLDAITRELQKRK